MKLLRLIVLSLMVLATCVICASVAVLISLTTASLLRRLLPLLGPDGLALILASTSMLTFALMMLGPERWLRRERLYGRFEGWLRPVETVAAITFVIALVKGLFEIIENFHPKGFWIVTAILAIHIIAICWLADRKRKS